MMRTVRGGLAALVVAGLVQSVGSLALVISADAAGTTNYEIGRASCRERV